MELDRRMEKFPSELSRRHAAPRRHRARHHRKPDLLLYDSPTGGLDPITSTNIIELIMKQRDVYHTTPS